MAFIGQARVRVRGAVQAGDLIVASGEGDGVGMAVGPERITAEQFEQAVGQAWETSANPGVKQVRVAVGLIRHDPTVKRLVKQSQTQAAQIAWLQQQIETVKAESATQQNQNANLADRLKALERNIQSLVLSKHTSNRK